MNLLLFYGTLILNLLINSPIYSQTPFSTEDVNSPELFYGNWKGTFFLKSIDKEQSVEISLKKGKMADELIVFLNNKQTNKSDSIQSKFNSSTLKVPFNVGSLKINIDSCKGSLLIILLDENHLNGIFNTTETNCTSVELNAIRVLKQGRIRQERRN